MEQLLAEEAAAFLACLEQPATKGLRVNLLKLSPAELSSLLSWPMETVAWCPEGFRLAGNGEERPGRSPYHAAGLYYLQEPSAMAAVSLLDPRPGETILDLCAAPGGKATAIAARLGQRGLLVANEMVRSRANSLLENLERFGVSNAIVTTADPHWLAAQWSGHFDAVLVDAPCSGEGLFRKNRAATLEWQPAGAEGCAIRQKNILAEAAHLVRPGGRLVYATCTFAPQENEGVIAHFLGQHPHFELLPPPPNPAFSPGRADWLAASVAKGLPLERCVRLWPHLVGGEGHFLALLQRTDEGPRGGTPAGSKPIPLSATLRRTLQTFWEAQFTTPLPNSLFQLGNEVYQLPIEPAFWGKLRPYRAGLLLGQLTGRELQHFIPAQALALASQPTTIRQPLDFPAGSPTLSAYLQGQTVSCPGREGWQLVTVAGFPVGWGKGVNNVLKNHYPQRLRATN